MRNVAFRSLAYSVIGLLALAALQMDPRANAAPAGRFASVELTAESEPIQIADTLGRGETLSQLFERLGLDVSSAREAVRAAVGLDARKVPAGLTAVAQLAPDSVPSEIVLRLQIDRYLRLTRTDSGWSGYEVELPWVADTLVVRGVVRNNLYSAVDSGAIALLSASARKRLTEALASLYDYRVDMSRDLQVGDQFSVLFERLTGPEGAERIGTILAATMILSGRETQAFRFESEQLDGKYFDQNGRPMKSGFLRSPLELSRISSNFGMRKHPILGTFRNHAGTDYAASAGSPVRAIGDGSVIFAGSRGGYGNMVDIRHRNGLVSRYAHLRGFGKGIRSGVPVQRESIIGYVGSTGLATGPHLHFEILVNGVQRNPRTVLANVQADEPIPSSESARFSLVRTQLLASLVGNVATVKLAQNQY